MKQPELWVIYVPNGSPVTVSALTRSEARSAAKKQLKIKKRLPPGTIVKTW